MSLPVLYYPLGQTDIGVDGLGNGADMANVGVTLVTDAERGGVASFDGTSELLLASTSVPASLLGVAPRTYMLWINHQVSPSEQGFLFSNGSGSSGQRIRSRINKGVVNADISGANVDGTIPVPSGKWTHVALSYDGGIMKVYVDGVLDFSWTVSASVAANDFGLGYNIYNAGDSRTYIGLMSDLRVYDKVLTAAEIVSASQTPLSVSSFINTPWSTMIDSSWSQVAGATSYRVTYNSGQEEETSVTGISSTEWVTYNLVPETTYVMKLYSSSDGSSFTLVEEGSVGTLPNTSENSNIASLEQDGGFDFSVMSRSTLDLLLPFMNDFISSGDVVTLTSAPVGNLTFIGRGSTFPLTDADERLIIPFDQSSGPSQSITITLSNSSSSIISYDEAENSIVYEGATYFVGDHFIIDGKKVTIRDV